MIINAPFFDGAAKLFVVVIKYTDGCIRRLAFEKREDVDGFIEQHQRVE